MAEHYRFGVVPEFLIGYRRVPGNMSTRLNVMANSHDLVLNGVKKRHPDISNKWYRWSRGNFRMYLALRSRENGYLKESMDFILKALQLDPPGTLLRHDTYVGALAFFAGSLLEQTIDSKPTPSAIAWRTKIQRQLPIKQLQRFRLSQTRGLRQTNGFTEARMP